VIGRALQADGDVAVFGHGHALRVLAARWLGLEPNAGAMFELSTATISRLGWERERRVIELWNEAAHLALD
jgi:probable phosphoglycerate mutase